MNLLFVFLYLISKLPLKAVHKIAKCIGIIAYYTVIPRRKIGFINLKLCFPNLSDKAIKILLKENFYHAACMLLEYGICWYASSEKMKNLVEYEDKHYLDDELKNNNKVILLYPHFYSFEICVFRLNIDLPMVSIYTEQKNKILDKKIYEKRIKNKNLFLIKRTDNLLKVIKQLKKNNSPFLYLPDQDFGKKDSIFVPFFNIPTATTTGLSRIARITNSKVIPMIPIRKNDKFLLKFYPVWKNFPTKDIIKDTEKMNKFIQDIVIQYPEQYFWLHKRFKTRPDNCESFYD